MAKKKVKYPETIYTNRYDDGFMYVVEGLDDFADRLLVKAPVGVYKLEKVITCTSKVEIE